MTPQRGAHYRTSEDLRQNSIVPHAKRLQVSGKTVKSQSLSGWTSDLTPSDRTASDKMQKYPLTVLK